MFEQGLKEEVLSLLEQGVLEENQCMQAIGYKEFAEGLRLGLTEEEIKELIKKNTRNYAKRQITFFKRAQNHFLLPPEEATAEKVLTLLEN
jgi:tRNA dimethylallyltransferase